MTKDFLIQFIQRHRLAVVSTTSGEQPEAAVVGIAVTPGLEIIFDTVRSSRKYANLISHPQVAVTIWKGDQTVQFEGDAVELKGSADDVYREVYYTVFPEGRERTRTWEGLVHFLVRPRWIRYSNFTDPPVIEEMKF